MIKIIFACLDEEQNLEKLLVNLNHELSLLDHEFEIIACLDGSKDKSEEIINNFKTSHKITLLPIKNQRGLGIAYKRLFDYVIENSNAGDIAISLDTDNTHNPEQICGMLKYFEKNSLDLLIASRFCNNSVMEYFPIHRKFISKSTSILLQKLFSVKKIDQTLLQDYTSGYRIYSLDKVKELHVKNKNYLTEPEFTYTCELVIKMSRINTKFGEIAISYDYSKKIGESKLRIFKNLYRLIILLFKLFLSKKFETICQKSL